MSPSTFVPPPFSPVVPVPEYLFRVATAYPDREMVCFLQDVPLEKDVIITSITWRQFLADVWARADYLIEVTDLQPRPLGKERIVVGLLAESNYTFLVDLVAMFTLRWQVLLISVRNSPDAILHLVQTTGCSAVFVDSAISHLHVDILQKDRVTGVTPTIIARPPVSSDASRDGIAQALSFLKESDCYTPGELQKEAESGIIYLHTSGSTGHPKAIAYSHELLLAITAASHRDRALCKNDVLYTCFPMFHAGGVCLSFPLFLGSGASFVCVDTWHSISVDTVLRHLRVLQHRKVDAALPPSMLEDIADSGDAAALATLAAQNTVCWGGAPLREDAGNYLVEHGVRLISWGGITEAGSLARSSFETNADPSDWMYMRLLDHYEFKWYPMKGDVQGRYNLVVSPISVMPPVVNSLDPIGFATADAWLPHPDPAKSHLWRLAGRLDDVTVLSNGEKTNNKQLEELLCASRHIYHAIIFGTSRFVNGAIVSPPAGVLPSYSDEDVNRYLDLIWPHIEGHVNKIVPQHSRLLRGMVLVASPDRPFLVSDKGTVKTKASLALYADDIERAYEDLESGTEAATVRNLPLLITPTPKSTSTSKPESKSDSDDWEAAVLAFVHALVADALGRGLAAEDDFFRNGMDSLVATKLRTSLSAALRRSGIRIPAPLPRNVVYAHPTVAALTRCLVDFAVADPETSTSATDAAGAMRATSAAVESMIAKYSDGLPRHAGTRAVRTDGDVYAVTGTTGSLGASFIAHLLARPHVKKVYLLNRGHSTRSMASRQEEAFEDKGISRAVLLEAVEQGRVEYVEIDVGEKRFGLNDDIYNKLTQELTHIVHNAWLLNFNLFLNSFEPHVTGVRTVIDLALASPSEQPPHITFISSVGAVCRWPFHTSAVPEAALNSPEFCLQQGYSLAKYVGEQILQRAVAQRPVLRAAVVRCSQLSGATTTGAWQKSEYVPRLLRSADALGIVPSGLQPVRWLPVDRAADILFREVEHAASQPAPGPLLYYSLDNTWTIPWERIVDALAVYRPERELKQVPMSVFLEEVRRNPSVPAYEVAEYLQDLLVTHPVPVLDTAQARRAAGALVDCEIGPELLSRYVRYTCA